MQWIPNSSWKVVEAGNDEIVILVDERVSRDVSQHDSSGEVHLARSTNTGFNRLVQDSMACRDPEDGTVSALARRIVLRWKSVDSGPPFFGASEGRFVFPSDRMDSYGFFLVPEKPFQPIPSPSPSGDHFAVSSESTNPQPTPAEETPTPVHTRLNTLSADAELENNDKMDEETPAIKPSDVATNQPTTVAKRKRGRPRKHFPGSTQTDVRQRPPSEATSLAKRYYLRPTPLRHGDLPNPVAFRGFPAQFLALLRHGGVAFESDDWIVLRGPGLSRARGPTTQSVEEYAVRSHAFLVEERLHVCCSREMPSPAQVAAMSRCAKRGLRFALVFDPFWAAGQTPQVDAEFLTLSWSADGTHRLGTWRISGGTFAPTTTDE